MEYVAMGILFACAFPIMCLLVYMMFQEDATLVMLRREGIDKGEGTIYPGPDCHPGWMRELK